MYRNTVVMFASILVIGLLIAGCTDQGEGEGSGTPSSSSTFSKAQTAAPVKTIVDGPTAYHAERCGDIPGMAVALRLYFNQKHEASLDTLDAMVALEQDRPEVHVWRAMNQLQLNRPLDARAAARQALGGDPELGLAHLVLADSYSSIDNPEIADDAIAWEHYVDAVEAAKPAPYAWMDIWREAVLNGRKDWEEKSIQAIAAADLFTDALIANTRWAMESAPENAILVVNGDMDTYPALVLQTTQNLRPDLVIINQALLNYPDYVMEMTRRHELTWPQREGQILELSILSFENETLMVSEQIVLKWVDNYNQGLSTHQVAAALTVPTDNLPSIFWLGAVLEGGCRVYDISAIDLVDTEAVDRSLAALDPMVIMGEYVSPTIINPLMLSTALLIGNPVTTGLRSAQFSLNDGQTDQARACFSTVEKLVVAGGLEADFNTFLQEFRAALQRATH